MANITGTNGIDTLTGTTDDDLIKGLGGNDLIIRSNGVDTIDGGAGNDTVDYSSSIFNNGISLEPAIGVDNKLYLLAGKGNQGILKIDSLFNIETVIGSRTDDNNGISRSKIASSKFALDVDLSKEKMRVTKSDGSSQTYTVKNFDIIDVRDNTNACRLKGSDLNNVIFGGNGDDILIGSKGFDTLKGSLGNNTIDYSNLGTSIKFVASTASFGDVKKGLSGEDFIGEFNSIIGATKQINTIDLSTVRGANFSPGVLTGIDLNLVNNLARFNYDDRTEDLKIFNFVDAIGSFANDTIVGSNKNSKLTAGGGNDTIKGGTGKDTITGTDSTARGIGEVDTVTGGGGRDKFVLGDATGAYYVSQGKDDYATITDFNLFQDSIDLGGFKDYSFASGGNNTIELYSGKDVNTRDLIAKIQLTGGISTRSTNSRSVMGADANLNAITSKIDILSGSSSTAEA
jgi:Ca2+-binding RTX toxin-like protein